MFRRQPKIAGRRIARRPKERQKQPKAALTIVRLSIFSAFDLFWLYISRQDITEALDITSDEELDEDTRNLRKSKQARKEDHRLYEQEERRRQREEEEEMRVQEEQKRLSREARKRNEVARIEAKNRRKRKRAALNQKTSENQRAIRDGQVHYSEIAATYPIRNDITTFFVNRKEKTGLRYNLSNSKYSQ